MLEDYRPMMYFVRDRLAVQTTCRVTWDDRFLYLAFDCREPRMAELPPTSNQRKRNRNTLVLSKSPRAKNFIRSNPAGRLSDILARKLGIRGGPKTPRWELNRLEPTGRPQRDGPPNGESPGDFWEVPEDG
ncbi:MAG: hypothetical protein Ct9H300mP1_20050 [Planctomycetaceae bacterium]|nr:MAG: hypothetical protein Ct9H300mP1_20050 [Planctomycetaceae bacterium]